MRVRRIGFIISFLMVGYVSVAGCGDEDPTPITDTGDTGVAETSTSKPDTSSSTTDTSTPTPDTSTPSDGNISDVNTIDVADARSPEFTGSTCTTAAQCYGTLVFVESDAGDAGDAGDGGDAGDAANMSTTLKGAPVCLDKVPLGYCTHECLTDSDCCAVPGECRTTLKQVCASFENTTKKYCFLSCEDADISAANDAGLSDAGTDGNDFCHKNMSPDLACRSTGGGVNNRKVCLPAVVSDGGLDAGDAGDASDAADAADADGG